MQIRSVTLFVAPHSNPDLFQRFFAAARAAFHVPVQTARIALPPFAGWLTPDTAQAVVRDLTPRWRPAGAG